ncbi:MAG: hypothetical protein U0Y82_05240 [Thermoleophilia bacterium]
MPFDPHLGAALDFTEADLRENRAGRLSAAQAERVAAFGRTQERGARRAQVTLAVAAVMVLAVIAFAASRVDGAQARQGLIAAGAAFAVVAGITAVLRGRGRRRQAVLEAGRVRGAEGTFTAHTTTSTDGSITFHHGQIGGVRFPIQPEWARLFRDGTVYRLHHLPHLRHGAWPLSVEPLEGPG